MREGLREVAHQATGDRVVFLRQEAEVVAQTDQPVEKLTGVVRPAQQRQAVTEPERAGQEGPLPSGEAVHVPRLVRVVPQHEPAFDELALDGLDGAPDTWVVSGQEAHERDHEQTGVELVGAVVLGERTLFDVEALVADLVVDLVADLAPAVDAAPRGGTRRWSGRLGRSPPRP